MNAVSRSTRSVTSALTLIRAPVGVVTHIKQLRDTEVEQLDLSRWRDHHVAGLEVAMDDELLMGVLDRSADALDQLDARIVPG